MRALTCLRARSLTWLVLLLAIFWPVAATAAPPTATPTPPVSVPSANTGPIRCRVGIAMVRLRNFNITGDTFDAEFWLWSVCPTDQLSPLKTVDFINATRTSVSLASQVEQDGQFWATERVDGTFDHHWDLTNFPFDRQVLEIQFEDSAHTADTFAYEPDRAGSTYKPDLAPAGWRVAQFQLTSDIDKYPTTYGDPSQSAGSTDYSRLTVSMTLTRTDHSGFFKLTFVVYIAFLISLISYFLNMRNASLLTARLSVISGALFAVAVNLRTATSTLGSDEGLTMVDWIHVVALVAFLIDAITALTTQLMVEHGRPAEETIRINRTVMVAVVIGFILANAWLIGWAIHTG